MSTAVWGGVLGALAGAGVLLVALRISVLRRPQLSLRVLPYVRDVPRLDETRVVRPVASGKTPYVRFDDTDYSIPLSLVKKPPAYPAYLLASPSTSAVLPHPGLPVNKRFLVRIARLSEYSHRFLARLRFLRLDRSKNRRYYMGESA